MLFYLDPSLINYSNNHPEKITEALEDLCAARRNGRHLIFSDAFTIKSLLTLPGLSARTHRTLSAISRKIRGKLSLFQACRIYIRLVHGTGILTKSLDNEKTVITISVDMIKGDDLFSKPRILVENRTDGEFYTGLAKIMINQDRVIKGVLLNYELVAGGGSQTPREYEALRQTEYLVYCIVDADIDYPGAPLGENTAAPIELIEKNFPIPTKEALILNCYSAENLIHPSMIKSALNLAGTESWFQNIEELFTRDLWQYLALKTKKTCADFLGESDKNSYWASQRSFFNRPPCVPACVKKDCSIFDPVKGTTLRKIADHLNESVANSAHLLLTDKQEIAKEWLKIKDGLLSWTCSGTRIS